MAEARLAKLPGLVLRALAHVLEFVKPFGLEAVLRLGAAFRPFNAFHEMSMSPNALRSCRCSDALQCFFTFNCMLDYIR